jgi:hypothetical protein
MPGDDNRYPQQRSGRCDDFDRCARRCGASSFSAERPEPGSCNVSRGSGNSLTDWNLPDTTEKRPRGSAALSLASMVSARSRTRRRYDESVSPIGRVRDRRHGPEELFFKARLLELTTTKLRSHKIDNRDAENAPSHASNTYIVDELRPSLLTLVARAVLTRRDRDANGGTVENLPYRWSQLVARQSRVAFPFRSVSSDELWLFGSPWALPEGGLAGLLPVLALAALVAQRSGLSKRLALPTSHRAPPV